MLLLALDCSTARGSLAVATSMDPATPLRWLLDAKFPAGRGHGGELFTWLERGLAAGRQTGERLEEIVVGLGPGSYSGVRQAIAAATGLALATGARLRGRPSSAALVPHALAHQVVADARRGAFYYTAVAAGVCVAGPELLPDLPALQARLHERPAWPVVAMENLPAGLPTEIPVVFPEAGHLLFNPDAGFTSPPLEPIYLRPVSITLPGVNP